MNDRAVVTAITRITDGTASTDHDLVAAESPLEIVLTHPPDPGQPDAPPITQSLGLVMRTPGDDADLVMGLLVGEAIVATRADIVDLAFEPETGTGMDDESAKPARARVTLAPTVDLESRAHLRALDRTSACGLCGRLTLQAIQLAGARRTSQAPRIDAAVIGAIPARLRRGQAVFAETGGLHAAAFCDLQGVPWLIREDVGRHNAVDKIVGAAFASSRLPATDALLAVSGRVAYEIVQKACAAGVVGIVAVGAPSSLAVDAARAAGLTLVGFTRNERFNVYAGRERIATSGEYSATDKSSHAK
jgi:FdhD protein